MTITSLKHAARISISNIDKKSSRDELPVQVINYTDVYYGDRLGPSVNLRRATATRQQIKQFHLEPGDVLITKDSETADDIGVAGFVGTTASDLVCGYHLAILRPRPQVFGRFLYWAICGDSARHQLATTATGVTRFGLRADAISATEIRLPSMAEQRAIADYLDAETARIDALITKKQQLIHLLEERINSAVFQGISGRLTSAEAPRRQSAIDWLGDCPAHWGTPALGAFYSTQLGKMLNAEAAAGPNQRRYIKNTNVQWDSFSLDELPTMSFDAADRRRCRLADGDLLVCEGGEVGRSAVWPGEDQEIYFQKALHRVRPLENGNTRFVMYCLWAAAKLDVFAVEGNQATIVHLTGEKLREHRFPMPPPDEQGAIVERIDQTRHRAESAISTVAQQVELLRERRQALITAAVTGEFEVPGVR